MVKARENTEAVESLKLRVQILLLISLVHIGVEPDTICAVFAKIAELHSIPSYQYMRLVQRDSLVLESISSGNNLVVNCKLTNRQCV